MDLFKLILQLLNLFFILFFYKHIHNMSSMLDKVILFHFDLRYKFSLSFKNYF